MQQLGVQKKIPSHGRFWGNMLKSDKHIPSEQLQLHLQLGPKNCLDDLSHIQGDKKSPQECHD